MRFRSCASCSSPPTRVRAGVAFAAVVIAVVVVAACSSEEAPARLSEDAYVWQRAWTPRVVAAVRERGRAFDGLRVLASEIPPDAAVPQAAVRLPSPAAALSVLKGKPVIPVVRVDGSRVADARVVVAEAKDAVARFRRAGADVRGVELDHDCAAARLRAYAGVVAAVKAAVAPLPVSITALPSWAPSPALDRLIGAADAVVLQVHSVDAPTDGLFSARRARAAIDAFARHSALASGKRRLFVALPAYGSALGLDDAGRVVAVESEAPRTLPARVRAAWAEPADVAALLSSLKEDPPAPLAGVVWFRLPVGGDVRAWSFQTLQAVRAGEVHPAVAVERDGVDVFVRNTGNVDVTAPPRVELGATGDGATGDGATGGGATGDGALVGDGVSGYAFEPSAGGAAFVSPSPPRLRVGERRAVGWVRPMTSSAPARDAVATTGGTDAR